MGKFLAGPMGSFLRVLAGMVLFAVMTLLLSGGSLADLTNLHWWNVAVSAAVGGALPILIAWLNPSDPRFGHTTLPSA